MTLIPGNIQKSPLSIGDSSKPFGTHYSHLGIGGFQEFESITERNSIPVGISLHYDGRGSGRRRHLMLASVLDDGTGSRKVYQLVIPSWGSLNNTQKLTALANNANWVDFNGVEQYIEQTFSSSNSVMVSHGWDKFPVVTLIEDGTNEIFYGDITYPDRNTVQADFNQNKTGVIVVQGRFGSPVPASPPTPFQYSKILFVDKTNGNDGTASKGDLNKPYSTVLAAFNDANSDDEIWIMNGTYPESQIVLDKNITLRLFGAIITPVGGQGIGNNIITGSSSGFKLKIVGQGKILNSGQASDDTSAIIAMNDDYYFEGVEISGIKFDPASPTMFKSKNCVFSYQVSFGNDNINKKLFFENCQFYNCDSLTEGGSGGNAYFKGCRFHINSDILSDTRPFDVTAVRPFRITNLVNYSNLKLQFQSCEFYSYDNTFEIDNLTYSISSINFDNCRFFTEDNSKFAILNNSPVSSLAFKMMLNMSNVDVSGNTITNLLDTTGLIVDSDYELLPINYSI